jgi:transcriptional regulator with XRE-family HTH domain
MVSGERLKQLRKSKKMTQDDIQGRTGLVSGHLSLLETGRIMPTIGTLEKMARALDLPLYRLFCNGHEKPPVQVSFKRDRGWGSTSKDARMLARFWNFLQRTNETDRQILIAVAVQMARSKRRKIK